MFVARRPYISSDYYTGRYEKPEIKRVSNEYLGRNSMSMIPVFALKSNVTFKCETQHIPEWEMESFLVSLIKPDNYQAVCKKNKGGLGTCSTIESIKDLKINSKINACNLLEKMWLNNEHLKTSLTTILVDIVKDDPDHPYIYVLENRATQVLGTFGYSANEITELLAKHDTEPSKLNVKTDKIQNNEQNLVQSKLERHIRAQMRKDKMDLNTLLEENKSNGNITEIFCNAVKNLNSEYKKSDNLKILFKEFLLKTLRESENPEDIILTLNTFIKIGVPKSENSGLIQSILTKLNDSKVKSSLLMGQISKKQTTLLGSLQQNGDCTNFKTMVIPLLKAIETIGQTDNEASQDLINILQKTPKTRIPQDLMLIQQHILKALAVVGKNDSDTTNAMLSFIENIYGFNRTTKTKRIGDLRYQSLESLFQVNKEKFEELTKAVLHNSDPDKFKESEDLLNSRIYLDTLKNSYFNDKIECTKSLLFDIEPKKISKIIQKLRI